MSSYRRPRRAGATVFFTVNLADRSSNLLVREIAILRQAVAQTRAAGPFKIDAWVVLPDHMHCVWTLPAGDADYSGSMGEIKGRFTRMVRRSGPAPTIRWVMWGVGVGVGAGPDLRRANTRSKDNFFTCIRCNCCPPCSFLALFYYSRNSVFRSIHASKIAGHLDASSIKGPRMVSYVATLQGQAI
ncbi:hypothetical protein C7964_104110 [Loktanella sp. PT4BL]|nr:hypothetical protein C7964_104110 [Loktanella sp. PT4BL]